MKRIPAFIVLLFLSSCATLWNSVKDTPKAYNDYNPDGTLKAGVITFVYIPDDVYEVESVYLAGGFNGWNPSDPSYMFKEGSGGEFYLNVELGPGSYKFKYVIDGEWVQNMRDWRNQIEPKPTEYVDDGGGKLALIELSE